VMSPANKLPTKPPRMYGSMEAMMRFILHLPPRGCGGGRWMVGLAPPMPRGYSMGLLSWSFPPLA
jgi:hypothetical protein